MGQGTHSQNGEATSGLKNMLMSKFLEKFKLKLVDA